MNDMVSNDAQPVQAQSQPQVDPQLGRSFTQEQVDKLIGDTRREARESALRNAQPTLSEDAIRKMVREEQQRAQEHLLSQARVDHEVATFMNRIEAAKSSHPELEKTVRELGLEEVAELVPLLNGVDNTAEALMDLAAHPSKIGNLIALNARSPKLALKAIKQLGASIDDNQKALKALKNAAESKEPLTQITPSHVSGESNGQMSIKELRKQSWMRR